MSGPASETQPGAPEEIVVELGWRSVLTAAAIVVGLTTTVGAVRAAPRTLTWLVIGSLLALALNPVVSRTEARLGTRRGPALVIVLAGFVTAIAVVAVLLGPATVR
ncbi:MAG: hypothetical protein AAGK32_16660, partial [Actinomycetota bacterium]